MFDPVGSPGEGVGRCGNPAEPAEAGHLLQAEEGGRRQLQRHVQSDACGRENGEPSITLLPPPPHPHVKDESESYGWQSYF
jgi:hypothetical protein